MSCFVRRLKPGDETAVALNRVAGAVGEDNRGVLLASAGGDA